MAELAPSQADHPVGFDHVGAFGGFNLEPGVIVVIADRLDLVVAADLDRCALRLQLAHPVHHIFFEIILLQVDEGREFVAVFGQQVEIVNLAVVEEHLAEVPFDALVDHFVTAAEPVEYFQRAFGIADRARAEADLVVVVEHDHGHVVLGQVDGGGQTDRSGADDDDRVAHRG